MHILLLNDDALPTARGGAAVIVDRVRRGYAQKGHRTTLIATHQDASKPREMQWEDAAGKTIGLFVSVKPRSIHRHSVSVTPLSARVREIIAESKPDVVHAHNVHNYLTYDTLRIARRFTPKVFLTVHDSYLASFTRVGGDRYRRAALASTPYRMHWWDHAYAAGLSYWPPRNRIIKRIIESSVQRLIVYSRAQERFLRDHGYGHCAYIHNGIDPKQPPAHSEIDAFRERMDLRGPTIFFAGRISTDKGIDVLLTAAAHVLREVPATNFLIAGDMKRLKPHLAKAPDMIRSAVRPTGWIAQEEMRLAYAASDVVTTPSIYLDNFPIINLEAMAIGKPVVGTCFGGTPEIVQDGITGFVVNPLETNAYAGALVRLLKDPMLREKMGKAGEERVRTDFPLQTQIEKHLVLFENT